MILSHETLFMVVGVVAGTLATTMMIAWLSNNKANALLAWAGSMASACLGLMLYVFAPFQHKLLMALSFGLESIGLIGLLLVTLEGLSRARKIWLVLTTASWSALAVIAPILTGYNGVGLIAFNMFAAAILLAAAWHFHCGPKETPALNRVASIVGLAVATSYILCAIVLVVDGQLVLSARPHNWAETINGVMILVGLGALTGHCLSLHQMRLLRQHEINASTDSLTGLLNRRGLYDYFGRAGLMPNHSFILLDLDHFKAINDKYGHSAGDAVLREFADLIRRNLREGDIGVRNGGEEFLLILPNTHMLMATSVAEKLRVEFARMKVSAPNGVIMATVSVGVAMVTDQDSHPDEVIQRADAALYEAKNRGRNRVMLQASEITHRQTIIA